MLEIIIFYFLPLLSANVIHHSIVIKKNLLATLAIPLDLGSYLKGKRLLGKSKTFRGFVVIAFISTSLTFLLTMLVHEKDFVSVTLRSFIISTGYMFGELPTSFLKRRFNINPSQQAGGIKGFFFYSLEQIDSVTVAVALSGLMNNLSIYQMTMLLILGTATHIVIDLSLYFKGYKKLISKPFFLTLLTKERRNTKLPRQ
ncbi:MAG: CDP-archaeol synthase [Patescibacteria group bacterium]